MNILRELRFWQGAVAGFGFAAGIDFQLFDFLKTK